MSMVGYINPVGFVVAYIIMIVVLEPAYGWTIKNILYLFADFNMINR